MVLVTFFVYFAQTCNVLTGVAYELFAPYVVFHYRNRLRFEKNIFELGMCLQSWCVFNPFSLNKKFFQFLLCCFIGLFPFRPQIPPCTQTSQAFSAV